RPKAQRLIADAKVSGNGVTVTKAAAKGGGDHVIAADRGDGYVSRGANKLVGPFERFADVGLPSAQGLRCL
ncbi:TlyA family RNA methyltransferase, partial [Bifidobacterium pseudocatenulatum]|nr:TlyA family RNA methyltransferase [Bifidobacterium pseudocatenulatum]